MLLTSALCCCSVAQSCPTLCDPVDCSTPGYPSFTISWSLLKLMSMESVVPSNHLTLCHPLLLPLIFAGIRAFSNGSALLIRWLKYWSFSFSISPFSEHSGLISFRMDWFDLLAVQGTLQSLLQHHNLKALCRNILFSQRDHPSKCQGLPKHSLPSSAPILESLEQKPSSTSHHEAPSCPVLGHIAQSTQHGAAFTDFFLLSHFHH